MLLGLLMHMLHAVADNNNLSFSRKVESGKLIIVYDKFCTGLCSIVHKKVSELFDKTKDSNGEPMFYVIDISEDKDALSYMQSLKYSLSYPLYFFKTSLVHHPEKSDDSFLDLLDIKKAALGLLGST